MEGSDDGGFQWMGGVFLNDCCKESEFLLQKERVSGFALGGFVEEGKILFADRGMVGSAGEIGAAHSAVWGLAAFRQMRCVG